MRRKSVGRFVDLAEDSGLAARFAYDLQRTREWNTIGERARALFDDITAYHGGDRMKARDEWRGKLLKEMAPDLGGAPRGSRDPDRDRLFLLYMSAMQHQDPSLSDRTLPRAAARMFLDRFGKEKKAGQRTLDPYNEDNFESFVRYLRELRKRRKT